MIEEEKGTYTIDAIPEPEDLQNVVYSMVAIPHLSPVNVFSASDLEASEVGKDDLSDAGIFQIDGETRLFSLTIYADHRRLIIDPETAAQILVTKAVRKLICYGAEPVAMSAFLNHVGLADPVAQQIVFDAKIGLEKAAEAFNIQLSDRKVHYDSPSEEGNVPPTLIVSLVGKMRTQEKLMSPKFKNKGNNLFLVGQSVNDISASEYLDHFHEVKEWPLMHFDLEFEKRLMQSIGGAINQELVSSASPVGLGGLFFTLLRASLPNDLGFDITSDAEIRRDAFLFGEGMGRIVVGVTEDKVDDFVDYMQEQRMPFFTLGHVTRGEIRVDDESFGFVDKTTVKV